METENLEKPENNNPIETLSDAVAFLLTRIDKPTTDFLTNTDANTVSIVLHNSFGRYVRNTLALWNHESPLVVWFQQTYGIAHADDLSAIIVTKMSHTLKNVHDDSWILEQVKAYQQYWTKHGCSPDGLYDLK